MSTLIKRKENNFLFFSSDKLLLEYKIQFIHNFLVLLKSFFFIVISFNEVLLMIEKRSQRNLRKRCFKVFNVSGE